MSQKFNDLLKLAKVASVDYASSRAKYDAALLAMCKDFNTLSFERKCAFLDANPDIAARLIRVYISNKRKLNPDDTKLWLKYGDDLLAALAAKGEGVLESLKDVVGEAASGLIDLLKPLTKSGKKTRKKSTK